MHVTIFNRAAWWRSSVHIKHGRIVPIPPFEAYNPFEFYHPYERGKRAEKSLHYEFAKVDARNPKAIAAFCERFGVLGRSTKASVHLALQPILDDDGEPDRQELHRTVRDRMTEFLREAPSPALCQPMLLQYFRNVQRSFTKMLDLANAWREPDAVTEDNKVLGRVLTLRLHRVRPRVEFDTQLYQWTLVWDAPSLLSLLSLMLLLDLLGPGSILLCPRCGTAFLGTRPNTRFCSSQCQNAFNVAEYYRRNPEQRPDRKRKRQKKSISR